MELNTMEPKAVVEAYWQEMQSNDFAKAASWLGDDFFCDWPQSGERIVGRENFIEINRRYPAVGLWRFEIVRLLAQGSEVVSEVLVSDGVVNARAITFHHVAEGKIQQQTEYWPDEYAAPEWRSSWVCPMPKS
ncbi:nuclear transport factor 2 family protein [Aeromonas veronii]